MLTFTGVLDAAGTGALWGEAQKAAGDGAVVLELAALEGCDTTGAVLLAQLAARPGSTVQGVRPQVQALMDRVGGIAPPSPPPPAPTVTLREALQGGHGGGPGRRRLPGEAVLALLRLPAGRGSSGWRTFCAPPTRPGCGPCR